ncbi:centromere protein I [Anguilla rostrata]|uniref:centromere protein I n=1 Tax=Anguilla rostrata TaxID=7938 RepID=UPI0030CFCC0B
MSKKSNPSRLDMNASSENDSSNSGRSDRSLRVAENSRKKREAEDPFLLALKYFDRVEEGTPWRGNDVLERHMAVVERVALSQGLPPEAITVMLDFALSLRMRTQFCVRTLKILIPASAVPQDAVIQGVSWLCVGKMTVSMQVMFLRWVLTVFDLIDSKDQLRAIYGFIFSFVTEESLCPYVCHLLYLLTRKESIRPYRVRKLLELQTKMGKQPFLMHLLALYKIFSPELVTLSFPSKMKSGFKNHNSTWKAALSAVQKRNNVEVTSDLRLTFGPREQPVSKKRKMRSHLTMPALSSVPQSGSSGRKALPLEQLRAFPQLLENLDRIELPAQMGSMLGSSLALHYLDCVRDSSAFLRLNFWLGHALHEEFLFCREASSQNTVEGTRFLNTLISTQRLLQEGFSSTEVFLYRFLRVWDGSLLRPEILTLLSDIPVVPSSRIKDLLFEPLMQLFFTSSLFFKCSVIECLNSMLLKWLTWHSVYALEDELDISVSSQNPVNMTLSGLMDSVVELVQFVGRIATIGLQLEGYHTLLLSFTLDFYETVCDMYLKYNLPLVLMPPAGVFYPALLSTSPVSVDRLCHVMHKYRTNLVSAKHQEKQTEKPFHISRKTYRKFNQYVVSIVSCLWNSRAFQPGMGIELGEDLLTRSKVSEYWGAFNLIHHPAFVSYAIDFHQKCWPERKELDLNSIKAGRRWDWYTEFLFCRGFQGVKEFVQNSFSRRSSIREVGTDSQ